MIKVKGKTVFGGIAIGNVSLLQKKDQMIIRNHVEDPEKEILRFFDAEKSVKKILEGLYEQAVKEVGETEASIFKVHVMMLSDMDFMDSIINTIRLQKVNAEFAVASACDNFVSIFEATEDEYMKGRIADIKDVSERLIQTLMGHVSKKFSDEKDQILFAEDLVPSETIQLDKKNIKAIVTRYGSQNSHTAILARTMSIPAVIQADFPKDIQGKKVVVDGNEGCIYLDPSEEVLEAMIEKQKIEIQNKELLEQLKNLPTRTRSGKEIQLYANVGNISDVMYALENDASGIGLFRSEFIYLESDHYPKEEEQFQIYKKVAEIMAERKVIIRTLDIGADKNVDYFKMDPEENPAMGYRAIRICLEDPELFKTQLRAIYRASAYGNISIMYPMIISVDEIKTIKELSKCVRDELAQESIPFREIEEGIMIETPAAALISDQLAKEVDFFSIGTNDLSQYTLAIDRQNTKLDGFFDPHHLAIQRLIHMTIENGHKAGIWVGICGELGADLSMTETWIRMGIDELSVSPSMVLPLRKQIRETE